MPHAEFILRAGKRILVIDLSHASDPELIQEPVEKAIQMVRATEGPGTLRSLIDLTGTPLSRPVLSALKRLSVNNGRYAKATAFAGIGTFWSILLSTFFAVRDKRNHKVLENRDEAIQWLEGWS